MALRGTLGGGFGAHARRLAPRVGEWVALTRTFAPADVAAFADLTGDTNPLHRSGSGGGGGGALGAAPAVHGILLAGLFSTAFGVSYPGCVYREQSLVFRRPAPVGDPVTAVLRVSRVRELRRGALIVSCDTEVALGAEGDEVAVDGVAEVFLPGGTYDGESR
jgi:3-hydroxybutyryl-CoA dehydratase